MKLFRLAIVLLVLVFAVGLVAQTAFANILQPESSDISTAQTPSASSDLELSAFVRSTKTGPVDQVMGVYVRGVFAFPVVQQPKSDASFVSLTSDTVTQFDMAAKYHSIGLLAHDFLAGSTFSNLHPGTEITLVFGDGSLKAYQVYDVQEFQALSPNDPYSSFVDLSNQSKLTADQLFYQTYGLGNSTLVLQTCISTPGVPSWGRLFVLARPVESSKQASFWDTLFEAK